MTEPVVNWMTDEGMYVAREVHTGWGICDLVGCEFREEAITYRTEKKQRQPLGSSESVYIYNQLPDAELTDKGTRLETLVKRFGRFADPNEIKQRIDRLIKTNHVRRTHTGSLQKVNGWDPMHSRLVAVELKLQRVTEVIGQAIRNAAFSTESYIALPELNAIQATKSRNLELLQEHGVGVISVNPSSCSIALEAICRTSTVDPSLEMSVSERFWKAYRHRHKH